MGNVGAGALSITAAQVEAVERELINAGWIFRLEDVLLSVEGGALEAFLRQRLQEARELSLKLQAASALLELSVLHLQPGQGQRNRVMGHAQRYRGTIQQIEETTARITGILDTLRLVPSGPLGEAAERAQHKARPR